MPTKPPRDAKAESQAAKLKAQADSLLNSYIQKSGEAAAKLEGQLRDIAAGYKQALTDLETQLKPFELLTNALNAGWKEAGAMDVKIKAALDKLYAKVNDMLQPPIFTGDPAHDSGELRRKYNLHVQFEAELEALNKLLSETMDAMNRAANATATTSTGIKVLGDQKAK